MGFLNKGRKGKQDQVESVGDFWDSLLEIEQNQQSYVSNPQVAPMTRRPDLDETAPIYTKATQPDDIAEAVYKAKFVDDTPVQQTEKLESYGIDNTSSIYDGNKTLGIFTTKTSGRRVGVSTVIGRRDSQQDAAAVSDMNITDKFGEKWMAILCDGMGGLEGGERASNLCVDQMLSMFRTNSKPIPEFYRDAIIETDIAVSNIADADGVPVGAGSTLVSVVIDNDDLYWASVGDSHIYVIRGNSIVRTNREHNYLMTLMEQVERGEISMLEAQTHKSKDALISYMGMGSVSLMDIIGSPFKLLPGDFIVLCSDGLYRAISQDEIFNVVNRYKNDMQQAADQLTALALSKNNPYQDNTTVIAISYQGS